MYAMFRSLSYVNALSFSLIVRPCLNFVISGSAGPGQEARRRMRREDRVMALIRIKATLLKTNMTSFVC